MILSKNVNNKKCAPKLIFLNEKRNSKTFCRFWLWKLTVCKIWALFEKPIIHCIQHVDFGQTSCFLGPTKLILFRNSYFIALFSYRIPLRRKRKSKKNPTKKAVWQLIIAMLPPKKSHKTPSKISQKKPQKFIQKNWLSIYYFIF